MDKPTAKGRKPSKTTPYGIGPTGKRILRKFIYGPFKPREKGIPGRKMHKPDENSRAQVKTLAIAGTRQELIAKVIGISVPTLTKHYRDDLETAETMANAAVARSLYSKATGNHPGAVTAAIFWLKCRAGWKEPAQDVNANVTGTMNTTIVPAGLTAETFAALAKKLADDI